MAIDLTKVHRTFSLSHLNSLRVECVADEYVEVHTHKELLSALWEANRTSVPVTLLGAGTNVVMLARIPGRVIHVKLRGITFRKCDDETVRVNAAAGESWNHLVRTCLGRGIFGLQNLALIPGTVGAAPIQNIGAYGSELAEIVKKVEVIDTFDLSEKRLTPEQCLFRYRDSVFKSDENGRYVITGLTLELGNIFFDSCYSDVALELSRMGCVRTPVSVAEAVTRVRRRKLPDPREIGNVGSFFKNPTVSVESLDTIREHLEIDAYSESGLQKISAARLIDSAGWRGYRVKDAGIWHRQALVLVNYGSASGREMLDLAQRVQDDIVSRFGIQLELEPSVLGYA